MRWAEVRELDRERGRLLGVAADRYEMFFELRDGRFSCELFNF